MRRIARGRSKVRDRQDNSIVGLADILVASLNFAEVALQLACNNFEALTGLEAKVLQKPHEGLLRQMEQMALKSIYIKDLMAQQL
jgi:hypothetical protein